MIFKKNKDGYHSFKLIGLSIGHCFKFFFYLILFISISLFFAYSALAEPTRTFGKEADLVVKKNGRVFLINRFTKIENFFNLTKPNDQIKLSKNEILTPQNETKKTSLAKARNDQVRKFAKTIEPFQVSFNQKNFIFRFINGISE